MHSYAIKVLLVDDQPIVGETLRQMLAGEGDIEFRYCQDPFTAIDIANEFRPTVILQDLVMPDIDGLVLVKYFRANSSTRDTPLVVLSSKEEPVVKARAFAVGANDYLVKLPDRLEVIARIRYHSRGYITLLERNEAYAQLAESQRQLAAEMAQAARYVKSLLPAKIASEHAVIDWRFIPSTQLGGDMFGYRWLDDDHLVVYLLDVSGHGVGSSLLAVSAANLLSAQSLPGVDCRNPGSVLTRLNEIFQMDRQNGKYFTIWYGVFRRSDRLLTYATAGHPPALLLNAGEVVPLATEDTATGIVCDLCYANRAITVDRGARLLLYSDGIYEIEGADGEMWKHHEFSAHISPRIGDETLLDDHLDHVRSRHGEGPLADDFSMVLVQL